MKISFVDFWDGFHPDNNFIYYLFRDTFTDVELVEPHKTEILIFSVFGNENGKYKDCVKIFFTGENIRPNFDKCNYSISFDFDKHDGKNIRIPLWYYYIDWFKVGSYGNPNYLIPESYLYEPNEFSKKPKNQFCSTVYSNSVGFRNQFVNLLSQYKKVDCFGKLPGFFILPDGEKQKLSVISNYKFNICFENSVYPGYYTEKLLHAKVAGCVPIYFSDEKVGMDFRKDCLLQINGLSTDFEIIEKIKEIDNDSNILKKYSESLIFHEKIELNDLKNNIFNNIKLI